MNYPEIETKNCLLKLLSLEQSELISDFYTTNKGHFKKWEPTRKAEFYTTKFWNFQFNDSIKLFKNKQAVRLVALNKEQTQIIAICNFSNIVFGSFLACHLGYSIDKEFEGKGLMFEIIQSAIVYMKDEFKLHRIMANYIPDNLRSEKLLVKLGFEKEGYAKDYLLINGKWRDHVLTSLIL